MFVPRGLIPEIGNKYYMRKGSGGYNTCIRGSDKNGSFCTGRDVLPNCVGYANGRFNEIIGSGACIYLASVNAERMISVAEEQGLKVCQTPTLGGCMVWAKGSAASRADGAGHVAIVEAVNQNGSIVTSDSAWKGPAFYAKVRSGANWSQDSKYKYLGCIVNPGAIPDKRPNVTVKRGMNGPAVIWVQQLLTAQGFGGYLGSSGIDGSFGPATERTVQRFQMSRGMSPDGVVGKLTKDALLVGFYVEGVTK